MGTGNLLIGEKLKKWNRKLSITNKVILSYIFLILIPACALIYSYYHRSTGIIEREVTNAILQTVKQAEINISYRLDNIRDISNSVFMNPNLHAYISRTGEMDTIEHQIEDAKELRKITESAQANTDVFRVRLFVDKSKIYSGEGINFFSLEDAKLWEWYSKVIDENGRIFWKGTYRERYIDGEEEYVVSAIRMLKNPKNYGMFVGILAVDIPEKNLYSILSGIDMEKKDSIFMIDADGRVISHSDKNLIGSRVFSPETIKLLYHSEQGIERMEKENTFIIHKTMHNTNWKIISKVPVKDITGRNTAFNHASGYVTIALTLAVFMLAVFLILAFLAEGVTKRIRHLVGVMKREGIESINEEIMTKEGDIYKLEKSVDCMIQTVKNLMEESYHAKMQEREAQLKALQAQINPHFLYNTLDTINWMAIKRNAEDISFMLDSLAKYFRLSLNKGKDIVSVSDELTLAMVYLEIQKRRFIDRFTTKFVIDEEVRGYYMPKLTLQPVVENALIHGIQKKTDSKGCITVEARKLQGDIIITVSDDGVGMDEDKIEQLLSAASDKAQDGSGGSGYGLYNVNERLKLFSGGLCSMGITSHKGRGTRVEIRFSAVTSQQVK